MARSLGYYGAKMNGFEYSSPLIQDMVETWGDDLSGINNKTTLLLIAALATATAAQNSTTPVDPNLSEVLERIDELSESDKISLIQALAN